jgi:hypothetical protein
MDQPQTNKPRILFLFSDTGGGHRSAMEAIIEALFLEYGNAFNIDMVDIFRDYAPRPFKFMPEWYPSMVKVPQAWGFGYKLTDGHRRARLLTASAWPYVRRAIRKLVAQHPSDLIVSVHPVANAPVLHALGKDRPPYVVVVTDLVSGHALWYHRRTDLCLVPTEASLQRGLHYGMKPEQVRLVGLPVADRFCKPPSDPVELRQRLGWPTDHLAGGGRRGDGTPGEDRSRHRSRGFKSHPGGDCRAQPAPQSSPGSTDLAHPNPGLWLREGDARFHGRRRYPGDQSRAGHDQRSAERRAAHDPLQPAARAGRRQRHLR